MGYGRVFKGQLCSPLRGRGFNFFGGRYKDLFRGGGWDGGERGFLVGKF